jgi:hypothetical protein
MLTGRVDELKNNKIYGWAFNSEQASEHLVIRVMLGPQVVASGVANLMRPDLPDAGVGDGDHAFEVPVPPNVVSFQGLMIIAQSVRSGEIPLPIATNDDRRVDELFSVFSKQYEEALIAMKEELDSVNARCEALESTEAGGVRQTELPDDLSQRLIKLETRIDSAEVFFLRIDEMVRKLVEESKKGKRKRVLGIF